MQWCFIFVGRLHEQIFYVDFLPMLVIDDEFSLIQEKVFHSDYLKL